MATEEPTGKLEQLPTELIQHILTIAPDIQSLTAAVLGGPRIYHSFLDAQVRITKEVLTRQIPKELYHDALAAEASSRQGTWTRQQAEDFLGDYFARDRQPFHSTLQWSLSQAIPLARLHETIEYFTDSLVFTVFAQKPCANPVSRTERLRIGRNFYRFQVYCNLFQNMRMIPINADHDQRDSYFSQFAPWEIEQLACIHDYLLGTITPAFEEVSVNDPDWVSFFTIMDNGLDEGALEHYLSFGLDRIRNLIQATDAQSQQKMLSYFKKESNRTFLAAALRKSNYLLYSNTLAELDSHYGEDVIPKSWFPDPDTGPEDIWRWALQGETSGQFIFSPSQIPLRQWAYVMWDRDRLDEWRAFDEPWEGIDLYEYRLRERSRRMQEASEIRLRAQNMVRSGKLRPSWYYL